MKKIILLVLSLAMLFSFTACGEDDEKKDASAVKSSSPVGDATPGSSDGDTTPDDENKTPVTTDTPATKNIVDEALALVKDGKTKEAYSLLYKNKTDADAKKMLGDFNVYHKNHKKIVDSNVLSCVSWCYEYDEKGRLVKSVTKDAVGGESETTIEYECDSLGRILKSIETDSTYGNVREAVIKYDSKGRVSEKQCMYDMARYEYDSYGNLVEVVDPTCVAKLKYGDGVVKVIMYGESDDEVATMTLTLDNNGNITTITKKYTDSEYTRIEEFSDFVYFYCPDKATCSINPLKFVGNRSFMLFMGLLY